MSEPATKQDLDEATGVLRGEMTAMEGNLRGEMMAMEDRLRGEMGQLRTEIAAMEGRLRSDFGNDMKAMEDRLLREIGAAISQAANVMMEHVTRHIAAIDDKYLDLPQRYAELRADFDAHAADFRLHRRPPAAPAKQTRRPRSR